MDFFKFTAKQTVIITKNRHYKYAELPEYTFIGSSKQIILILCSNTVESLSAYIYAMNSGHAVMLLSADINAVLLRETINNYMPNWIIGLQEYEGYRFVDNKLERFEAAQTAIHPDLALLLSTSGTTGDQKFVRLSYKNLEANASSIIQYLEIKKHERAIMNLPLSYSYGMSIVNSHLRAGASLVLTDMSIVDKDFWTFVAEEKATSIAGVPFTYQMLQRIGFTKMDLPYLKVLTQAGGRLSEKLVHYFAQYAQEQNKKFYVMYGQTEASPRISYIPYKRLLDKIGSIGIAIPGGELAVDEETSELIYRGPNVMMGYARSREDLHKGDELHQVLRTGDTAEKDSEGYYTITGRLKRFVKIFGLRINLDEVEKRLESELSITLACTGTDDKLIVVINNDRYISQVEQKIVEYYKLHKSAYKIRVLQEIPRLSNGKTDYSTLKELCI